MPRAVRTGAGPGSHDGAVQGRLLDGPGHPADLDEPAVGERVLEVGAVVVGADPAPEHQVRAGGHCLGRVQLEGAEVGDDVDHVVGAGEGEQLGAHGDPPGLVAGQLQHGSTLAAGPGMPTRSTRFCQ